LLRVRLYRYGRGLCPAQRDRHPADAAGERITAHRAMVKQLDRNPFVETQLTQAARFMLRQTIPIN